MSRAYMGSSAVAPPSRTAKRSSEIAPSTCFRRRMNATPANTVVSETGSVAAAVGMRLIVPTSAVATSSKTKHVP